LTRSDLWEVAMKIDGYIPGWSKRLANEVFDVASYRKLPEEKWQEFYDFCSAEAAEQKKSAVHDLSENDQDMERP